MYEWLKTIVIYDLDINLKLKTMKKNITIAA